MTTKLVRIWKSIPNFGEDVEQQELSLIVGRSMNWLLILENNLALSTEVPDVHIAQECL